MNASEVKNQEGLSIRAVHILDGINEYPYFLLSIRLVSTTLFQLKACVHLNHSFLLNRAVLACGQMDEPPIYPTVVSSHLPQRNCLLLVSPLSEYTCIDPHFRMLMTKKTNFLLLFLYPPFCRRILLNLQARSLALTKG